jgi:la-related protein 1
MYYVKACGLEKRASTTWLEWSKMEEENGRPLEALKVLKIGLGICKLNDTLLPRSIKLHERLCLHDEIREFLATLRQEPLERTWKSILEGCMFEARIGNYSRAREIYKFLMSYVPWYGPIYFEAFRLEEREGNDVQALAIIKSGLKELPRYGPLWFGLMRIMERRDIEVERRYWYIGESPKLEELSRECDEAVKSISKELTWRVHYERFQAEERASEVAAFGLFKQTSRWSILECRRFMLSGCRKSLTQSLLLCPSNLRWKLFLVGARLELGLGNIVTARDLIQRSFQEVPSKSKASVYIECSRLEEYIKNFEVARSILSFAKTELQNDWRLCLESILLEARRGNMLVAVELAREAVAIHPGTGRIWALYIQLNHRWESSAEFLLKKKSHMTKLVDYLMDFPEPEGNNYSQKFNDVTTTSPKNLIVRKAIMEVPKSGEVWCEEGRCRLNPFLLYDFDLGTAQKSFSFAIQFTPQYGDTFIEYLRLELICHVILKFICQEVLFIPFCSFIKEILNHDNESDLYYQTLENSVSSASNNFSRSTRRKMMRDILELKYDFEKKLDPSGHYEFPQLLRR